MILMMYHFRIKDTWEVMSSSSACLISKQNAVSDSLMWPHALKWDIHLSLSLHLLYCFTARHLLKSRWLSIDNKNLPTPFCQKNQHDFLGEHPSIILETLTKHCVMKWMILYGAIWEIRSFTANLHLKYDVHKTLICHLQLSNHL